MLTIEYRFPSHPSETAASAASQFPTGHRRRRRLRHYLIGSREDTQYAIDRLHQLGYLDRLNWSHVIEIPENGLIIRPDPGDVLRYTQRAGRKPPTDQLPIILPPE